MSQVSASDWNPLVSTLQSVLSGWGAPASYSSYAVDNTREVNHLDWNAVVADINTGYTHITGSNSSLSTVATGTRITQANLTNASAAVTYINTNRYTAAPASYTLQTVYDSGTVVWSPWSSYYSVTWKLDWASATQYTRYWNNGGYVQLNFGPNSYTDGWSGEIIKLMNNMGTLVITPTSCYQSGQTWSGTVGFQGALNASTGGSTWLSLTNPDTSYTADYMTIAYQPNNTFGSASSANVTWAIYNGRTTLGGASNSINGNVRARFYDNYVHYNMAGGVTVASSSQA
jgi:hypothetical protein